MDASMIGSLRKMDAPVPIVMSKILDRVRERQKRFNRSLGPYQGRQAKSPGTCEVLIICSIPMG